MNSDEKRIDYGVMALAIVFGYICFYLLISLSYFLAHFIGYGSLIALIFLFVTFCLIAFFTIRPVKTQKGNAILGLTSMIFGVVIFLLPLIDILILSFNTNLFLFGIQVSFLFLVAGVMLLWNGISMCRKNYTSRMLKKGVQNMNGKKRDYGVVALAIIGCYISLYLLISFGYNIGYGSIIALILLFITFCLIAFFAIRPAKTQKGKTILGLTSMIFGVVILLLPWIDILILASNAVTPDQLLNIFLFGIQVSFLFLVAGVMLLWNGISMFRKNYTSKMLKKDI